MNLPNLNDAIPVLSYTVAGRASRWHTVTPAMILTNLLSIQLTNKPTYTVLILYSCKFSQDIIFAAFTDNLLYMRKILWHDSQAIDQDFCISWNEACFSNINMPKL